MAIIDLVLKAAAKWQAIAEDSQGTAARVHTHVCKGEKREHVHLCVPVRVRNTTYAHVFMRAYMCYHTHVYVGGECVSAGIYTCVFAQGMEDEGLIAPGVTRMLKPGLDLSEVTFILHRTATVSLWFGLN